METLGDAGDEEQLWILKRAVENTNEAFVTIDENHKVLFFNKAAEMIFGYRRDEVIGHDLDVIMSPSCSKNHRDAVARYSKTRVPRRIEHETEILATRKNGESFPASISFSVTEGEGHLFFTGIVRDMTETRALQEQIMKSERLAALGQFVAEITHEIKNPLMMIGGFVKQVSKAIDDDKNLEKMEIILEEVHRLEKLLADLREFYLPKNMVPRPVDIKNLLEEILSLVREDCEARNIQVHLSIGEEARIVAGDPDRLTQVFLNLVKNAIEAMENGGTLSLASKTAGSRIDVMVNDEGCGISDEDKEKIFSPFFTTKSGGTGLGLCISKRIIEEHAGSTLSMFSEKGKGSTFKISLPKHTESAYKARKQTLESLNP